MGSQNFRVKNGLEVGTGVTITSGGNITAGIITATVFYGSAAGLSNIPSAGIASIATYASNAGIATYATSAGIASIATYASNAGIATYATSAGIASIATYASNAGIATYATSAGIASIATYASNAGIATYATSAGIATYATDSGIATYATSAGIATYATSAGIATYATDSGIATYATSAGIATYATSAGIATYATSAGIATYATSAGIATYATSAGIATYATDSGIATYATSAGIATSTTNIPNLTGDMSSVNTATTLATVNSNVGTFGSGGSIPSITVNAKGLVTGVTTTAVNPANDGTLTLEVSGTGLSGSTSFTANQSSNSTFTVTSNATNSNNASTIVARDGSGNFSAGTITATLNGNASSATYTSEWILGANGSSDYTFTGPGLIGAENDPVLYLVRGQQYKFTNTMGAHPFRIQSTVNGSTGTQYNDGITNNDVSNGTLTWNVQFDAPNILYYQCTAHGSMGGKIYIIDAGIGPDISINTTGICTFSGVTNLNQVTETVVYTFNTTLAPSSGTLTIDTSLGTVFLGDLNNSVTTWEFTNVPTTNSKATTITAILDGDTGQTYGDACSVNGSAISNGVKWAGGSSPTSTNNFDILSFIIVKDSSGTINVFGSGNTNFS